MLASLCKDRLRSDISEESAFVILIPIFGRLYSHSKDIREITQKAMNNMAEGLRNKLNSYLRGRWQEQKVVDAFFDLS